jgi:hypothetical protein
MIRTIFTTYKNLGKKKKNLESVSSVLCRLAVPRHWSCGPFYRKQKGDGFWGGLLC